MVGKKQQPKFRTSKGGKSPRKKPLPQPHRESKEENSSRKSNNPKLVKASKKVTSPKVVMTLAATTAAKRIPVASNVGAAASSRTARTPTTPEEKRAAAEAKNAARKPSGARFVRKIMTNDGERPEFNISKRKITKPSRSNGRFKKDSPLLIFKKVLHRHVELDRLEPITPSRIKMLTKQLYSPNSWNNAFVRLRTALRRKDDDQLKLGLQCAKLMEEQGLRSTPFFFDIIYSKRDIANMTLPFPCLKYERRTMISPEEFVPIRVREERRQKIHLQPGVTTRSGKQMSQCEEFTTSKNIFQDNIDHNKDLIERWRKDLKKRRITANDLLDMSLPGGNFEYQIMEEYIKLQANELQVKLTYIGPSVLIVQSQWCPGNVFLDAEMPPIPSDWEYIVIVCDIPSDNLNYISTPNPAFGISPQGDRHALIGILKRGWKKVLYYESNSFWYYDTVLDQPLPPQSKAFNDIMLCATKSLLKAINKVSPQEYPGPESLSYQPIHAPTPDGGDEGDCVVTVIHIIMQFLKGKIIEEQSNKDQGSLHVSARNNIRLEVFYAIQKSDVRFKDLKPLTQSRKQTEQEDKIRYPMLRKSDDYNDDSDESWTP